MPLTVGMRGEPKDIRPAFEERQKLVAVRELGHRDVELVDHEAVFRHQREVIADELHLLLVDARGVLALLGLGGGVPDHIIEHEEVHRAPVERVVLRPHHALPGVVGECVIRRVIVLIVIAGRVVMRQPEPPHDLLQRREHLQIVVRDIAERQRQGRVGAFGDDRVDDIPRHEVHLPEVAHLLIAEDQRLEAPRLLLAVEREVHRFGQRASGGHAAILQLRRALRVVDVVAAGDAVLVDHWPPVARLDDEDDIMVVNLQPPAPVLVGEHHIAAVGDADIGDTGLTAIAGLVAVNIVEDDAGRSLRPHAACRENDQDDRDNTDGHRSSETHEETPYPDQLRAAVGAFAVGYAGAFSWAGDEPPAS